jgi:hypothetical protein
MAEDNLASDELSTIEQEIINLQAEVKKERARVRGILYLTMGLPLIIGAALFIYAQLAYSTYNERKESYSFDFGIPTTGLIMGLYVKIKSYYELIPIQASLDILNAKKNIKSRLAPDLKSSRADTSEIEYFDRS